MPNLIPDGQYTVERSWHQQGDEFFPCITIVFPKKEGEAEHWDRIVTSRGSHPTLRAARDAADALEISAVYDNGLVEFAPPAR